MSPDEVEAVRGDHMFEFRIIPRERRVALFAVGREAESAVVDGLCPVVVRLMAGNARRVEEGEGPAEVVRVARFADELFVCSREREGGLRVHGQAVDVGEGFAVVAGGAVVGEVSLVHVHVAGGAVVDLQFGFVEA